MTGVQTCALPICFPVTIQDGGSGVREREREGERGSKAESEIRNAEKNLRELSVSAVRRGSREDGEGVAYLCYICDTNT